MRTPASEIAMPANCAQVSRIAEQQQRPERDEQRTRRLDQQRIQRLGVLQTPIGQRVVGWRTRSPTEQATAGTRARNVGQSVRKCGHANGSSITNAPTQRMQDSVIGGTWPPA